VTVLPTAPVQGAGACEQAFRNQRKRCYSCLSLRLAVYMINLYLGKCVTCPSARLLSITHSTLLPSGSQNCFCELSSGQCVPQVTSSLCPYGCLWMTTTDRHQDKATHLILLHLLLEVVQLLCVLLQLLTCAGWVTHRGVVLIDFTHLLKAVSVGTITRVHARMHTYTYTHAYTHTHAQGHTYMHTHTHTYTHTYTHTHAQGHTYTHARTHAHIHTYVCTSTHTYMHARTRTHICDNLITFS